MTMLDVLGIVLVCFKVFGVINWPWFLVLLPFVPTAILWTLVIAIFILGFLASLR